MPAAPARSTSRPPATPPSAAPPATRPISCFAVCGSKRSLNSDQNPETRTEPTTIVWRKSAAAAGAGCWRLTIHSAIRSSALTAAVSGVTTAGPNRAIIRARKGRKATDRTDDAITAPVSADAGKFARKKASRVALAATCCAIMIAAVTAARLAVRQEGRTLIR